VYTSKLLEESWVLVAHTYHPSCSGGRDQKDVVQSQPEQKSSHYLEKPFKNNRASGMAQGEGPEFKPQECKINK
jgi:hypothetical protein